MGDRSTRQTPENSPSAPYCGQTSSLWQVMITRTRFFRPSVAHLQSLDSCCFGLHFSFTLSLEPSSYKMLRDVGAFSRRVVNVRFLKSLSGSRSWNFANDDRFV